MGLIKLIKIECDDDDTFIPLPADGLKNENGYYRLRKEIKQIEKMSFIDFVRPADEEDDIWHSLDHR